MKEIKWFEKRIGKTIKRQYRDEDWREVLLLDNKKAAKHHFELQSHEYKYKD